MAMDNIATLAKQLASMIAELPSEQKIDALNKVRTILHEVSPFKSEPVDLVLWERVENVHGNDYNPNVVAPPEMRLLRLSIAADGYTQPVVTWLEGDNTREVVDGFHRHRVAKECPEVRERLKGYLPVTTIRSERTAREDCIAATIRHNRARGRHIVAEMAEIVQELSRRNWTPQKIAKELGMEPDEVLRLRQITGLAELFAENEFSEAWELVPEDEQTTPDAKRR
jgi:ParB-like chromosome segregation protein Spo0J